MKIFNKCKKIKFFAFFKNKQSQFFLQFLNSLLNFRDTLHTYLSELFFFFFYLILEYREINLAYISFVFSNITKISNKN